MKGFWRFCKPSVYSAVGWMAYILIQLYDIFTSSSYRDWLITDPNLENKLKTHWFYSWLVHCSHFKNEMSSNDGALQEHVAPPNAPPVGDHRSSFHPYVTPQIKPRSSYRVNLFATASRHRRKVAQRKARGRQYQAMVVARKQKQQEHQDLVAAAETTRVILEDKRSKRLRQQSPQASVAQLCDLNPMRIGLLETLIGRIRRLERLLAARDKEHQALKAELATRRLSASFDDDTHVVSPTSSFSLHGELGDTDEVAKLKKQLAKALLAQDRLPIALPSATVPTDDGEDEDCRHEDPRCVVTEDMEIEVEDPEKDNIQSREVVSSRLNSGSCAYSLAALLSRLGLTAVDPSKGWKASEVPQPAVTGQQHTPG